MCKNLPKLSRNLSCVRCQVSHEVINEENPAFCLPTGYVIGKKTLERFGGMNQIAQCPISKKKIKPSEVKRVFFI